VRVRKNEIITIVPEYLNELGEAVTETEGFRIVCKGLLPGENAEIKIVKTGRNVAFGKVISILSPDKDRVVPECKNKNCGTCELIFTSYRRQMKVKKEFISVLYGSEVNFEPSVQFGYRNKAVLPVAVSEGNIKIGTYRQNSRDLTDWDYPCPVLPEVMNRIISSVKRLLSGVAGSTAPEHLYIRGQGNAYQAGFIVKDPSPEINNILAELTLVVPEVKSVFYSLSSGTNSVLVKNPVFVKGDDHIVLMSGNGEYRLSPCSFFQANTFTPDKILVKIGGILAMHPRAKVLDLYSGCGVLSNFPRITRTCIESNASSFGFTESSPGTEFIVSDVKDIPDLIVSGGYDIIIADPPRKGIDRETLKAIDNSGAHTFIYLSCEPKTQKRDIDSLINYEISEICGFDMFPNTVHIESLAVLKM
jgi:23S rRNA (uracil1939-C5)-methyltransferase